MIGVKWKCIEKLWTFTTPQKDQLGQEEIYWGADVILYIRGTIWGLSKPNIGHWKLLPI